MKNQDFRQVFSQIIVKTWKDPQFKQKLLKDPQSALREEGIDFQDGINLVAHANTDNEFHFILPRKPSEDLSDQQLAEIAAGLDPEKDLIDWLISQEMMLGLRKPLNK
jgi:Nitrile hydratase, alpha chain